MKLIIYLRPLLLGAVLLCLTGLTTWIHAQAIRYVRANGTGDGSSWAQASGDLQDMINASGVQQVWVATGYYYPEVVYAPELPGGSYRGSFSMKSGVEIYGGFPDSGNPDFSLRDPATYPSSLSGFNQSYHIIKNEGVDQTALLDGFTISSGAASGDGDNGRGGGIFNRNSSPRLTNCIIRDNRATQSGGGIYNDNSSPRLTRCTVQGNRTNIQGNGGGMYNSDSSPELLNCVIQGNMASDQGGGVYNLSSNPTLTDCLISDNTGREGGGVFNRSSSPRLINCTIQGNSGGSGGGGIRNSNSSPTLENCLISGNTTYGNGGGILNANNSNPRLTGCTIRGNSATYGGGGISAGASSDSPTLVNCLLEDNTTAGEGGGFFNRGNATLTNCVFRGNSARYGGGFFNYYSDQKSTLVNCTFSRNSAVDGGGAIFHSADNTELYLINCILWDNGGAESIMNNDSPGKIKVSYSLLENGIQGFTDEGNNRVVTSSPFVSTADLQLRPGSPAIDAGLNEANTTSTDLAGKPRLVGARIDMGAYEYAGTCPIVITQAPASQTACVGSAVSFSVIASGPAGLSYAWYKNSAEARQPVLATTPDYTVNVNEGGKAGRYLVRVSAEGCPAQQAEARLTVNQRPVAPPPTSTRRQLCPSGEPVNLGQFVSRTNPAYSVRYSRSDGQPVAGSSVIVNQPGSYAYQAIQVDPVTGCESVPTYFTLTVGTPTTLTQSPPTSQSVCSGSDLILSVGAQGSDLQYEWFRGSVSNANELFDNAGKQTGTSTASLKLVKPSQSGSYFVRVSGQCGVVTGGPYTVSVQACGGRQNVTEGALELQVRVLGNPVTTSQVSVEVRGAQGLPLRLELRSISGSLLNQALIERAAYREVRLLEVGAGAGGVLLLRVSTPTQSQTIKIIRGQ